MALVAAAGFIAAAGVAVAQPGVARLVAASLATGLFVLWLVESLEAAYFRQRASAERQLLRGLVARLPDRWYVLGDLELEPSWLEPVRVWAVVVGPGGLAVVQPCTEQGELTPHGHLWMVSRGGAVRTIPSPAAEAGTAAEALREILGVDLIPVVPVVALTDINSVFHQGETGAQVVGGPHLADGLQRRLGAARHVWDGLQLAAYLSRYHR